MAGFLGLFLLGVLSTTTVEIPTDQSLKKGSIQNQIQIWLRQHISNPPKVACRFVGQDPKQGKPRIFGLDCNAEKFEEELPFFLDYCDQEIKKNHGSLLGVVAVGSVDLDGFSRFVTERYEKIHFDREGALPAIQLIPTPNSDAVEVMISYPSPPISLQSSHDIKELWIRHLLQKMVENRLKQAVASAGGQWVYPEAAKTLLPTVNTVGHGVEHGVDPVKSDQSLLNKLLQAVQDFKTKGIAESELEDFKALLIKHIKQFYELDPDETNLADYYAAHLAYSGAPSVAHGVECPDYFRFMSQSLRAIPTIEMNDVLETVNSSFVKDGSRQVVIKHPGHHPVSEQSIQVMLSMYGVDAIECKLEEPKKIEIVDQKDPFTLLPITEEEQTMIRDIIKTVADTNPVMLGWMRSELEAKRKKLLHIHPFRSLATMCVDPPTKKNLEKVLGAYFKGSSFLSDFSARITYEADQNNLEMYIQGFSLAVKANPEKIRTFVSNREWEKMVKYVVEL